MMYNSLCLKAALAAAALCLISAVYGSCPSGWTSYNGSGTFCVKKFYHKKTWFEARASCRRNGVELVTVVSYGESNFMKGYLRHTGRNWWTAGNEHSGYWKWDGVKKSRFGLTDWGRGEPNNDDGKREDCMALWHDKSHRWNDQYCYSKQYYVCEKRG